MPRKQTKPVVRPFKNENSYNCYWYKLSEKERFRHDSPVFSIEKGLFIQYRAGRGKGDRGQWVFLENTGKENVTDPPSKVVFKITRGQAYKFAQKMKLFTR